MSYNGKVIFKKIMLSNVSIMVVNIKCKRFIPDVARIRQVGDSADPPKASKQTIQQATSARKKKHTEYSLEESTLRKWHPAPQNFPYSELSRRIA